MQSLETLRQMRNLSLPGRKFVSAAEGYQSDPERFKRTQHRRTLPGKFTSSACRTIDTFLKVWFHSHSEIRWNPANKSTRIRYRNGQFPPDLKSRLHHKAVVSSNFICRLDILVRLRFRVEERGRRRARMPILP
jgi:hypothetical protein